MTPRANTPAGGVSAPAATGDYEPLVWQPVFDAKGFGSIHETDEDGAPGDLIAEVFHSDHFNLMLAAPTLLSALEAWVAAKDELDAHPANDVTKRFDDKLMAVELAENAARAAIAAARSEVGK